MIGKQSLFAGAVRGLRTKSGLEVHSGLELARLPEHHFRRWSEQVLDAPLPLKTFLSQHRPLMNILPPKSVPKNTLDSRDIMFVDTNARSHSLFGEHKPMPVPYQIANELGPFHVGTPFVSLKEQNVYQGRYADAGHMPKHARESLGALAKFLERHNREPAIIHMPLNGKPYFEVEKFENDTVEATSVRRKRKLKMNRHKYRKRLKEQRTLKRRLEK